MHFEIVSESGTPLPYYYYRNRIWVKVPLTGIQPFQQTYVKVKVSESNDNSFDNSFFAPHEIFPFFVQGTLRKNLTHSIHVEKSEHHHVPGFTVWLKLNKHNIPRNQNILELSSSASEYTISMFTRNGRLYIDVDVDTLGQLYRVPVNATIVFSVFYASGTYTLLGRYNITELFTEFLHDSDSWTLRLSKNTDFVHCFTYNTTGSISSRPIDSDTITVTPYAPITEEVITARIDTFKYLNL